MEASVTPQGTGQRDRILQQQRNFKGLTKLHPLSLRNVVVPFSKGSPAQR